MTNVEMPDQAAPSALDPGITDAAPDHPKALLASAAAATALLAACGGGGESGGGGGGGSDSFAVRVEFTTTGYANPTPTTDAEAARFLQQAQFSSTVEEIASARNKGYVMWLATEFSRPLG